ncbi:MAG TPA: alpha/beta fold hydrolase [Usitatibacteraceae bacterium]
MKSKMMSPGSQILRRWIRVAILAIATALLPLAGTAAPPPGFTEHTDQVNGVGIHYYVGGKGSAVVLLHGYVQTSHMWRPIMGQLAKKHMVIVPDLRGAGGSEKPATGYDKKIWRRISMPW